VVLLSLQANIELVTKFQTAAVLFKSAHLNLKAK